MINQRINNQRFIILLILGIVFSMLLTACAGAGTPISPDASQSESSTSNPPLTSGTSQEQTTVESSMDDRPVDPDIIRIGALKGPTGMGLAWMADQSQKNALDQALEFSFSGSPDDITAKLISGQLDIAALPTNLAAVLYQKMNQDIQLLAINTLGVLYILESGESVQTIEDLADKRLEATGQGAVPEYVLEYMLTQGGIRDRVSIEYKAEHAELATLAVSGQSDLVMLPEPFVTTVLSKRADMRIALDLTQEWQRIEEEQGRDSSLAMGCLVVTKSFAQQYPQAVAAFLSDYQKSTEFTNENPVQAGVIIQELEILADAELAAKAIPNSYITLIQGDRMQPVLEPLLQTLLTANPQSVGGRLPDADFYYVPD